MTTDDNVLDSCVTRIRKQSDYIKNLEMPNQKPVTYIWQRPSRYIVTDLYNVLFTVRTQQYITVLIYRCALTVNNTLYKLVTYSNSQSFHLLTYLLRDNPVRIATRYWLEGSGIEPRYWRVSRTLPNRPCGPPSLLYNGYRVFPGGKAAGAWLSPLILSSAEVKERVVYTPSLTLDLRGLF